MVYILYGGVYYGCGLIWWLVIVGFNIKDIVYEDLDYLQSI